MTHLLMRLSLCFGLLGFTLSLTACSSLTHSKDDASLNQVKRAALVAFSVNEPTSAHIGLSANTGKASAVAGGSMIAVSDDANISAMYTNLSKAFANQMHWNMMNEKLMLSKPGYTEAYNKTMKGWQNKMPPGEGIQQFEVKDVMDYDSPRILDVAGRDRLIEALGVDAIVVARVDVVLSGTTVMGIGSRHPQSNVSFFVYKKGEAKPIWFEGKIEGSEQESVGKTAFIDEKLLSKLALKSADDAYAKIGTATN